MSRPVDDPTACAILDVALRDFVLYAWGDPSMRSNFEADTRHLPLTTDSCPLGAMIDAATNRLETYQGAFLCWVVVEHWGLDWAPDALREWILEMGES